MSVRRIKRAIGTQGERRASDSENIAGLLRRVTAIERKLELIEPPKAQRISRILKNL